MMVKVLNHVHMGEAARAVTVQPGPDAVQQILTLYLMGAGVGSDKEDGARLFLEAFCDRTRGTN